MKTGRKPTKDHCCQFNPTALKKAMKESGVSAMELRETLKENGVHTNVHQVLLGTRTASFSTIALCARLIGVPLDSLVKKKGKMITIHQHRKAKRPPGRPSKS